MNPESEISCHTTLTECNNWFILPQIHSLLQFVLGVQAKSEKNLSCHRESNSTAKYQIPNFQFRLDSIYFLFLPLKNVVMISVQSSLDLETSLAPLSQFFFFFIGLVQPSKLFHLAPNNQLSRYAPHSQLSSLTHHNQYRTQNRKAILTYLFIELSEQEYSLQSVGWLKCSC